MSTLVWNRYCDYRYSAPEVGLFLDLSRVRFPPHFLRAIAIPVARAIAAMGAIEAGHKANCDEDRMVGHYWLRAPQLAPNPLIGAAIRTELAAIQNFSARLLQHRLSGHDG